MPFIILKLGSKSLRFKNAKNYDEFAKAQKFAANNLISLLTSIQSDFNVIYEIGCGSGILSKMLMANLGFKRLILNDLFKSQIMNECEAQIGDITQISMPSGLDLVISSSVFQWIYPLEILSAKIFKSLNNGGLCAFCMLSLGSLNELSSFTNQSLEYKNPDQIDKIFSQDFQILAKQNYNFIDKFQNLKELLNSLKQTGVNNLNGNFKLNKSSLNAMDKHFNKNYKLSYNFYSLIMQKT